MGYRDDFNVDGPLGPKWYQNWTWPQIGAAGGFALATYGTGHALYHRPARSATYEIAARLLFPFPYTAYIWFGVSKTWDFPFSAGYLASTVRMGHNDNWCIILRRYWPSVELARDYFTYSELDGIIRLVRTGPTIQVYWDGVERINVNDAVCTGRYAGFGMEGDTQWRKAVLESDEHTCQDCGVAERVDAHHIRSIIDYPEGIFEVKNGLTLCEDCHKRHTLWQRLRRKRRKVKCKKRQSNG